VRIDLAGVSFLDSSAIGALLESKNAAENAGRTMSLIEKPDGVRRVLAIAGLSDIFSVTPGPARSA